MHRNALLVFVIAIALTSTVAQGFEIGIAGRIPPMVSIQLAPLKSLALEIGLSGMGPLVLCLKAYPTSLTVDRMTLLPVLGLGAGLAFLPGDIVASGFFGLVSIEISMKDSPLKLFGELAFTVFTHPAGGNPSGIGPAVGGRIDLPLDFASGDH
jgi:hypothetical protein